MKYRDFLQTLDCFQLPPDVHAPLSRKEIFYELSRESVYMTRDSYETQIKLAKEANPFGKVQIRDRNGTKIRARESKKSSLQNTKQVVQHPVTAFRSKSVCGNFEKSKDVT